MGMGSTDTLGYSCWADAAIPGMGTNCVPLCLCGALAFISNSLSSCWLLCCLEVYGL